MSRRAPNSMQPMGASRLGQPAGVLASRLEGISEVLPAIGNEPGRILLPVVSADLLRAQDMVLFLAFVA